MSYQVKDSGQRREFGTGAVRDMGGGKGRTDLLPFFSLLELSKHFEAGAVKYGDENWRKGIPLRVYLDSAVRHLFKLALGMRDERHDLAALWNVACLIETQHMIDRGILPADLANLPNWHDADDGGDAYGLTAEDIAGMPLAGALPGAYGCDDVPAVGEDVKPLDNWLDTRFPADPNAPASDAVPVRLTPGIDYPVDLRPQDRDAYTELRATARPYTRGHAEETAARFNAGVPYYDDAPARLPAPGLPTPDLLAQVVEGMAAEAIADNPLFHVVIIDGADAPGYDGPEVQCALDGCGCKAAPVDDTDPLDGRYYVVLGMADRGTPRKDDPRRWQVEGGRVFYRFDETKEWEASKVHNRDSMRLGLQAGNFYMVEAGAV